MLCKTLLLDEFWLWPPDEAKTTLGGLVEVDPPGKRSCSLFFVLFPWGNLQNTNRRLIIWTYNYIPFDPRIPYKLLLGKHQSWNAVWKNPPKNKWRNNILSWIFAEYWRKKTLTVSFLNILNSHPRPIQNVLFLLKKKKVSRQYHTKELWVKM